MKPNKNQENKEKEISMSHRVWTILGTILCVILLPILIMNLTLITKSYLDKDQVPSVGGYFPMIVLTDSMYPEIQSGDLIICHTIDAEEIRVGDVISFFDPEGNGTSVVTHRVTEVTQQDGSPAWRTQGDANNVEDAMLVPAENLVGIYQSRIAGAGNVAMFMQTTQGLIICVICPIILLVGYDVIRRRLYEKSRKQDTDALLQELEELRRLQAEKSNASGKETKDEK